MSLLTAIRISGTGLSAERIRLNVASMNIANAEVTKTLDGGPYRARSVIFTSEPLDDAGTLPGWTDNIPFQSELEEVLRGVAVTEIVEDPDAFKEIYDPAHPDADERGIVLMPNVNVMEQMVDMMTASRAYEANITAIQTAKAMAMKALDIAR
ncbi:MAG TPA: flagellar basal body rod protein FlgC [Thermodesulfobacteriaceae bacterium]|nr:flagellar basal body rod protein FlgC [Thermodesulfobacteriaceae bacterium]